MKYWILAFLVGFGAPVFASEVAEPDALRMDHADVVILGEVHDNPSHHAEQARLVGLLKPRALVFEMLTEDQATRVTAQNRQVQATLMSVLEWDQGGWPDFAYYFPIISAAPQSRIYGANLTRGEVKLVLESGVSGYFGSDAPRYGLDKPLSDAQQAQREAFQRAAHCQAMPENMLGIMVDLQRLRDALLARAVVTAMAQTGGPVVVITGNGHARRDQGLAVYLQHAQPDLTVYALGQSEDGQIEGDFDAVLDHSAVERPDPCLAFAKQK
jgi:uncharacterized iron-regulated protein